MSLCWCLPDEPGVGWQTGSLQSCRFQIRCHNQLQLDASSTQSPQHSLTTSLQTCCNYKTFTVQHASDSPTMSYLSNQPGGGWGNKPGQVNLHSNRSVQRRQANHTLLSPLPFIKSAALLPGMQHQQYTGASYSCAQALATTAAVPEGMPCTAPRTIATTLPRGKHCQMWSLDGGQHGEALHYV